MAFNLGTEGVVVLVLIILLFGAGAIPKLARSLGRAKGEFQRSKQEFQKEVEAGVKDADMEQRIRKTARDLGIPEEGKPLEEVKKALNEKLE